MVNILVLYYSAFGHTHRMAEAEASGAAEVQGAVVTMRRVPETLPEELRREMGIWEAQREFEDIPICTYDELLLTDAIIFGTPTRFGNMCSQMRAFLDGTGPLWGSGGLVGKLGGVFTSTNSQHGGQETTIFTFYTNLLHHGMIVVGLPYTFKGQERTDEVTGCSPYGASTIAGSDGKRFPSENELAGARFQGRYVAEIASKLTRK